MIGSTSVVSGDDGRFEVELEPGDYTVSFHYADVMVKRTGVRVEPSRPSVLNVKMDMSAPAPDEMKFSRGVSDN